MSITAVIKRPNLIVANTVPLTTTQSNPPLELKNNLPGLSQSYVHSLLDVSEVNPQTGDTLQYNSETRKYEVKPLPTGTIGLDGGGF